MTSKSAIKILEIHSFASSACRIYPCKGATWAVTLIHRSSRSIGNNHLLQAVNRQAVKGHLQIWRRPTTPSRRSHGGQRGSATNTLSGQKPRKGVADRPAFTRGSFRSHHHFMRSGATVAHPPRPP